MGGWCPGTFLRAVWNMLLHVVRSGFVYLFVAIPFALVTHLLFNDIDDYKSPQIAFMTLLASTPRGGDYGTLWNHSVTGCVIHFSYLVVGTLLLLNMVIGLVGNVTREQAEVENMVHWT